ncbi:MAG: ATP-binding cassette domain-containing protein [Candidatus Lokiarchaeota archaeon]|nr:ATP-binding cassette domain-containing protein [Candidatus Lokiarchaeota archaeon]
MSGKWLIRLDHVTISYKVDRQQGLRAGKKIFTPLCDVNMDVQEGEFLSISGPNGSGKTSLLKVMSGVMEPFTGSVSWDAMNFGFVSQYQILLPELTIRENILLPFYLNDARDAGDPGTHARDPAAVLRKLDLYVNRFKIEDILEKHPKTCSIGQQQRALLTRALIMDRDIIFADEPEQNLDSDGRMELFQSFKEANTGFGKTIVLVSQEHPDVLRQFATRGIKIKGSNIVEIFRDGKAIA